MQCHSSIMAHQPVLGVAFPAWLGVLGGFATGGRAVLTTTGGRPARTAAGAATPEGRLG